jgi:hypothetical protein
VLKIKGLRWGYLINFLKLKLILLNWRRGVRELSGEAEKLEAVEFWTSPENHAISLRFHDKTMLVFDIELGFSIFADYSDWKTGNYRPIQRWRPVRSRLLRE